MSKGSWLVLPMTLDKEKGCLNTHGGTVKSFSLPARALPSVVMMLVWLCSHGWLLLVSLLGSETKEAAVSFMA
jgi:hypothetical protein